MKTKQKQVSDGDKLRLKVLQLKVKLPRNYITFYTQFYPDSDNDKGKDRVRKVVNLQLVDDSITKRLENLIDRLRAA